ncbi:adenosine-deaminase domain-containing protein [Coniochaeta sp. 2T2.1]|nr:adenosine-deaminase domain-containing protein [Coniochaeta sp. 2T2.1]
MLDASPDEIASLVLRQFDKLPQKRKPAVRDNGIHEWVPMSGIVAEVDGSLTCLCLATGMKCLPATKLALAKGSVLHDWHAEILAIRAFNHFLLQECKAVTSGQSSTFTRRRTEQERRGGHDTTGSPDDQGEHGHRSTPAWEGQPFALREEVKLHMYCSEAPCGDASMELTMAAQDDASPWDMPLPAPTTTTDSSDDAPDTTLLLSGRGYFSQLGTVRRKPARGDAPPTLSKSCSDKLALKQCASLLSSLTSLLVHPGNFYLSSVILPESQFSATGCERSFSSTGRMTPLAGRRWEGGYKWAEFAVRTTELEFEFSKREVARRSDKTSASNLAVAWTAAGLKEGLAGGVLQGRKQFDVRGGSGTCRRRMWQLARDVAGMEGDEELGRVLEGGKYGDVKGAGLLERRRRVKDDVRGEALKGWVRNVGDEEFGL